MPPIGLLLGKADFSNLFIDLSGQNPVSIAEAQAKALPVIAYGRFINDIVNFLIVAFVIFLVVKAVNRLRAAPPPPPINTRLLATVYPRVDSDNPPMPAFGP